MKIGVIGFGRLGSLLVKYLSQDATVYVYDQKKLGPEVEISGAIKATLEEISECKIIIPTVPISHFEDVIKEIAPLIRPETLIIDVCSVKEKSMNSMKEFLPKHAYYLGSHPMFGPDSASETLFGTKIVLCKGRLPESLYQNIKLYLEGHGIKVIESTPEIHDKEIGHSLLLTHFIGRALIDFQAEPLMIDTKGYRRLMKILKTVENDSWQLFEDMNLYNNYAKDVREDFITSLTTINNKVQYD